MNEVDTNLTVEDLHNLYLDDLSKIVNYGGNDRPRVAHPGKWRKLNTTLNESMQACLALTNRKVWVWSDLHFWHKNIIRFSQRPYDDLEQMHEHLLLNHNELVGPDDIVIWGGDVGFGGTGVINEMLAEYNGYKILIAGNHDFNGKKFRKLAFDETHLAYAIEVPEQGVSMFFTHYPMHNIPKPWVNVHGHLHGFPNPVSEHPRHLNINCEVQGYKPVALETIVQRAKMMTMADEL